MSNASGTSQIGLSDEKTAEIAFKIIIYIVGIIGNLLVIFVILFLQEYKKTTHWYVLQMALADIIFLQNLPFKVGEDLYGRWIHADWLCGAQQTVLFLTYYASIMFLVIMAVDRYLTVCHPMSSFVQRARQPKIAYVTALTTWIVAILMSIPVMLNSSLFGLKPNCNCRLQFPVNEHVYCVQAGFGANEAMMQDCRQNVFPFVSLGNCVDPPHEILFEGILFEGIDFEFSFPSLNATSFGNSIPVGLPTNRSGLNNSSRANATTYTTAATFLEASPQQLNQSREINVTIAPPRTNIASGDPFAGIDLGSFNFGTFNLGSFGVGSSQPAANGSTNTSTGTGFVIPTPPTIAIAMPPTVAQGAGSGRQILPPECHYDVTRTGWSTFTIVNSVVMFLVPLLIISICYGLIIKRLAASSVSSGSGKAPTGKSDREKRKVTILCALLTILFTIFWLPFHAVQLAKLVGIQSTDKDDCVRLVTSASMLAYLSSATNPYLYNFVGTLQKRMKQIKDSKRMQSILSAAGITRFTSTSKTTSSSDGIKDKSGSENSAIPMSSIAT